MPHKNKVKSLREIAELTQAEAADLLHVSLSTWKRWEANDAELKPDKVEAFKAAVAAKDIPKTGIEAALQALRDLGRSRPLPPWCSEDDPFGQRSGDKHRINYRNRPSRPSVDDAFVVMKSDDVSDEDVTKMQAAVDLAKEQGKSLDTLAF